LPSVSRRAVKAFGFLVFGFFGFFKKPKIQKSLVFWFFGFLQILKL